MTNKEAISNLEQLYPLVSETMKRAIDTAVESLENEPRYCTECGSKNKHEE